MSADLRYWSLAWLGVAGVGIANGAVHRLYARRLGELRAHQVSGLTFAGMYVPYVLTAARRHPLRTRRAAFGVGVAWAAGAAAFDAGVGHFLARDDWRTVLEAYDLRRGRIWGAVVLLIAAGPALARSIRRRRTTP
jgi:hypothetical protein